MQYSALRFTTCCWGDLLKLSICEAEKMEGWGEKKEKQECLIYSVPHFSRQAKILLLKSKCRTWVLSKQTQHQSLCSAGELHFTNVKRNKKQRELRVFSAFFFLPSHCSFSEWNQNCLPLKQDYCLMAAGSSQSALPQHTNNCVYKEMNTVVDISGGTKKQIKSYLVV